MGAERNGAGDARLLAMLDGRPCSRLALLVRSMVATAVLGAIVACGGDDGGGGDGGQAPLVDDADQELVVEATEMAFDPAEMAVAAGPVRVVLRNVGLVVHDFRIEGIPNVLVEAQPGAEASGAWELSEGDYRVFCSIPGHREAGMVGTLRVG